MRVNLGFFLSKVLRLLNRPALRNCDIASTAKVGTGSNCISVKMGRYSYMGKNNSVCNAEIGAFCSIASYCAIGGGEHAIHFVSTSPVFNKGRNILKKNFALLEPQQSGKTTIGNDVWVGEQAFIKAGITIGDGAVIGAHAVVTHDIPPYAIVAGAPAKIIRFRFSQEEIEKLLKLQWWNWSEEKLKDKGSKFSDVGTFLKGEL